MSSASYGKTPSNAFRSMGNTCYVIFAQFPPRKKKNEPLDVKYRLRMENDARLYIFDLIYFMHAINN